MLPMNRLKMNNKKRVSLRTFKSYKNTRYGASVLIGLFEKCARTNAFSASDIFKFNPHPYRMRLEFEGLSHALPNSPPDCLVPSLCSGRAFESHLCTKNEPPQRGSFLGCIL